MAAEEFITNKFMEGFGLDYPEDLEKFNEVFSNFTREGGSPNQLFKDLVEVFPNKREKIRNAPMFKNIDGEVNV